MSVCVILNFWNAYIWQDLKDDIPFIERPTSEQMKNYYDDSVSQSDQLVGGDTQHVNNVFLKCLNNHNQVLIFPLSSNSVLWNYGRVVLWTSQAHFCDILIFCKFGW